jgi:1-phosphofructokinase
VIVTVTLNPSLDRTVEVAQLHRGEVNRAHAGHLDAGGKGVNVTRALTAHGLDSVAVLPVGGTEGRQLVELLAEQRITVAAVPIAEAIRSNVSVIEPDGTVTKINEPGATLSAAEAAELLATVQKCVRGAGWVVAAGSLPPGLSTGYYADLTRALAGTGVQVAVDTSGPALLEAAKAAPALIKPNREELADAVSHPIDTVGDVVTAAQQLRGLGVGSVLASLGSAGAVLVTDDGVWHGEAKAVPRSTVGAGDALLAGFLSAGGIGPDALATGLAWAAAAVSLPGSRMPGPADVHADTVRVHSTTDLARRLDERS